MCGLPAKCSYTMIPKKRMGFIFFSSLRVYKHSAIRGAELLGVQKSMLLVLVKLDINWFARSQMLTCFSRQLIR